MNECLAIDIGGYLHTNNLDALIALWLDASQISQDELNMSARESGLK